MMRSRNRGKMLNTRLCQIPAAVLFCAHGGCPRNDDEKVWTGMTYGTRGIPFLDPVCDPEIIPAHGKSEPAR